MVPFESWPSPPSPSQQGARTGKYTENAVRATDGLHIAILTLFEHVGLCIFVEITRETIGRIIIL